jgi:hypothetical protein
MLEGLPAHETIVEEEQHVACALPLVNVAGRSLSQ